MFNKIVGAALLGAFAMQPLPAFADHDRWGHEEHHEFFEHRHLPPGYLALAVAGMTYFYRGGHFYRYAPTGYVLVEPPAGAIVPALPPGYTTVVVRQTPYYYYDNTYYVEGPAGYVVTTPPPTAPAMIQPTPVPAAAALPSASEVGPAGNKIDSYDIYIPNDNGSYTLVTLKKSDKGFIGPQGEFYPEHPTVEQLKTLYGASGVKK